MSIKRLEAIPYIGQVVYFLLKIGRLYLLYKPALFLNQLRAERPLLAVHWISPDRIENCSHATFSRINKRLDIGKVVGGDWDRRISKFTDLAVHQGLKERFIDGRAWEDTVYYKDGLERIKKGERVNAANNIGEFRDRLRTLDELYTDLQKHGFQERLEARTDTYRHKSWLFRVAKGCEGFLDYIMVDIDRHGRYLLVSGKHRLAIAKLLDIGEVPVILRVCHKDFEKGGSNDTTEEEDQSARRRSILRGLRRNI